MRAFLLRCWIVAALTAFTAGQTRLPAGNPADLGMAPERLGRIDGLVAEAIARAEIPGAVVVVAHRGQVVYRRAFGQRSIAPAREPMTVETIFDAASLTKVMATAPAIMILSEEGRVSLSDPAANYIPEFAQHEKDKITVLQLLTHYSGLRPDLDLDTAWQGHDQSIALACAEKPIARPGEKFIYSDINYVVLGEIVRRVGGKSLAEFAAERIFRPLGMTQTGFLPDSALAAGIAPTEPRDGVMLRGAVHDPTAARMGGVAGNAGLFTTVDDLAVYAQMLLNLGAYGETRILSPLGVLAMTTTRSPAGAAVERGAGFDISSPYSSVRGDLFPARSFGHTGFTGTSLWIDPLTQTVVIVFTNRLHPDGKGNATPLRKRIASVVAASILDVPGISDLYGKD
jgi:CubicO group peptidase (beta-lactamase class C family)